MLRYKISVKNPTSHYIDVALTIDNITSTTLDLQLPAWRPGRYELGNFAKNIKQFQAFDDSGNNLNFSKSTKDLWHFPAITSQTVTVTYSYYTSEINAGNCYADEYQLYVNPVHLCMYVPNQINEQHVVELDIPDNYKIATSLAVNNKTLTAINFDELADSPFMASSTIQSDSFEINGITFWLHFNGECKPDFGKIKSDFIKFTKTQLNFWGDFPVTEYHYLFQILPFKMYHGVEHQKSTVIAIGPGYAINKGSVYEDVLGVSCHELFHTWNIKYIRPIEMLPYDYSKENYARTGFVYEGFTTYYGDALLYTSGVFTTEQYFDTLQERLVKHFHNYGRFNLSVANSSWETWLDGYVPGAPYRKTSIYDEGNLVAFMLDVLIMKCSNNTYGLKNVCQELYNEFGKKQKGYSEHDIRVLCEKYTGKSLHPFFDAYVFGTENFEPQLQESFDYLGWEFNRKQSTHINEAEFGFKVIDNGHAKKVTLVAPNSPSWQAGLSIGDDIIAVNNMALRNDLNEWLTYFNTSESIEITVLCNQIVKTITLNKVKNDETYFDSFELKLTSSQQPNYLKWMELNS